jgi:hypothetical protein
MIRRLPSVLVGLTILAGLAGCGEPAATAPAASASDSGGVAPGGGDIPDNQVYLTYTGTALTIKYPEGWVLSSQPDSVTFGERDNRITVTISQAPAPTTSSVGEAIRNIKGAVVTTGAHTISLPGGAAILATYQVDGPADAVTGKRPRLTVDHYELAGSGGRKAVIELGNRLGDDNVDAYRMIAESFRWR